MARETRLRGANSRRVKRRPTEAALRDTYQTFWTFVADRRDHGRSVLVVSHFVIDEDRFDRIVQVKDGLAVPR